MADSTGVIAQITNLSGPSLSLDTADVTEHDGDGWEEVVGTILRSGTVTAEIVYDPVDTSHARLLTHLVSKEPEEFTITFPNTGSSTWTFNALVTGFAPSAPVGDALKASITLKPTGKVTT